MTGSPLPPLEQIDALLLDLGGVMVHLAPHRFLRHLARDGRLPDGPLDSRFFALDAYHRFARGEIDPPSFHAALEQGFSPEWSFERFVEVWCDIFDEIDRSVEALGRIRAVRPVHLLSNTDVLHFESIRRRWNWMSWFSGLHLSYEQGVEKPDPSFYLGFLERTGLAPDRCLFIDDRADNVEAALGVGLHAVMQRHPDVLAETVDRLLDGSGR